MTDNLDTYITSIVAPITSLFLNEAETEELPFCVYSYQSNVKRTKDDVYAILSYVKFEIISKEYDDGKSIGQKIYEAVDASLKLSTQFVGTFNGFESTCTDGIWNYRLDYTIKQIN